MQTQGFAAMTHPDPREDALAKEAHMDCYQYGSVEPVAPPSQPHPGPDDETSQSGADREVERILALSDEEVLAEVRAEGRDPVQVANEMRNAAEAVIYATRVARELVAAVIGQGDAALPTVVHALLYARNAALMPSQGEQS
jgi:hypothetical protein